jgi:hypothetical protein
MSFPYTQNFNTLNDGDLNGQDSWSIRSGYRSPVVQTTKKYEGAKGLKSNSSTPWASILRTITALSGNYHCYFTVFAEATNKSIIWFMLRNSSDSAAISFQLATDGKLSVYDFSTSTYIEIMSFSANTWYVIDLEYDIPNKKYRARAYNGSSWSAYSSWCDFPSGWSTDIVKIDIWMHTVDSSYVYLDYITDTNPILPPVIPTGAAFLLRMV